MFKPGDVIVWDTWCGVAYARVEWLAPNGECGLMARDGYSEWHPRIPRGARIATEAPAFAPARPIAYE